MVLRQDAAAGPGNSQRLARTRVIDSRPRATESGVCYVTAGPPGTPKGSGSSGSRMRPAARQEAGRTMRISLMPSSALTAPVGAKPFLR